MNILILVIPMSLVLGSGFVFAFLWATSKGQFDDLETPSRRMLSDDFLVQENKCTHERNASGKQNSADTKHNI
ncbi:MAG: cbb3-type cytochrome oxidase assembly protein CcoS [Bdellovibrio sp.]|nr:cbb3-type cytochrome oxidase assembly protein CcoS [Bdellovibrio sp.]